jgi:predicted Rossmann fold nucleotide-binding protein DprA/Smf involved in DNA uptake
MVNRNVRESRAAIGLTQFALLLHSVPHLGEKALARLLRTGALLRITPEEFLALSETEWRTRYEFDPRAIDYLSRHREALIAQAAELARSTRAHAIHILTCDSLTYPDRIERFDDAPPPILYALGDLSLIDTGHAQGRFTFTTAISNGAPREALDLQDRIAADLVAAGGVPVTGHDRLPYQRLALCAQRAGRPVIYVFDRGLREALGPQFDRPPFAAARIRDAVFDPARDLALSPFRLDDHGLGANNRRRDRLVFALADLVVAVDVRAGGGMAAECLRAHEQGRQVCVADGGRDGNQALRAAGCAPLPEQTAEWVRSLRPRAGEEGRP